MKVQGSELRPTCITQGTHIEISLPGGRRSGQEQSRA